MHDICTYQIEVRGQVDEDDLNAMSPLQMTVVRGDAAATLFTICTDQSGLIGLLRHLHGRGFVLLSVTCKRQPLFSGGKMSAQTAPVDLLKNAGDSDPRFAGLPVTRDLTPVYALSLVIALVVAVASAAGLLYQAAVYPAGEPLHSFVATDTLNLVVGLPILLGSMWLTRRGKLLGLLCWPAMPVYVLYIHVTKAISVPFGVLFLPYLVLVPLSAYTTIGLVASIDGEMVCQRLTGAVPARLAGGILFGISFLYLLLEVSQIVTALTDPALTGAEMSHWIADWTTLCPAWLIGGFLLWRRQALGYVAGVGLLLLGSLLFIGAIPVIVFTALYTASPIDVGAIVQMLVMGLICFIPFGLYVRGIVRS